MEQESSETQAQNETQKDKDLYNTKEKEALNLFREEITRLSFTADLTDHFLIRWLRARNLDIKKATDMLKNYYEWNSTNQLLPENSIGKDWIPPEIIVDDLKYKFLGFDSIGRPVIWMPIGRWEVRLRLEAGLKNECFLYAYQIMYQILKQIECQRIKSNGKVSQFVAIIDCNELYFRKLSFETLQCTLRFFREFEAYFPEIMAACYVVNTPMVFSIVYNLVKPLMSAATIAKLQIFDSNETKWKPVLQSHIPLDILPADYGGNAEPIISSCYNNNK